MIDEKTLLSMDDSAIVAYFSPYCRKVALSAEFAAIEQAKEEKKRVAAEKKSAKEALAKAKAAEKELLSRMTKEEAKAYRKKKKLEASMVGQPTLFPPPELIPPAPPA